MAKDNIALLNEIAGQLRKLNQANLRDTLRTKEFQDRQEAIMAGQPQAEDQGPLFVDAAEDFRRRVKGSVTGARLAEEVTASGKRAKGWVEDDKNKKTNEGIANTAEISSETHLKNIHKLLIEWRNDFTVGARNAARDAAENTLEAEKFAPGMHPNSIATRIKPGFGLESEKEMPVPEEVDKGNFITRNIKKVVTAVTVGSSMAISDIIRGYKRDGIDGAVASFLGGNAEGGLANSIRQAFTVGTTGVLAGAAIGAMGGPIGALAGGIIGLAIGAITGFLGADRINAWMDETGKSISDAWAVMSGKFISIGNTISSWIYTPGTSAAGPNRPAVNAKILGGFISWEPGNFSISDAWNQAMGKIKNFFGDIGKAIYNPENNTFFGGTSFEWTAPDWFDGIENSVMKVWNGIKDFGESIKHAIIRLLPDWLTDRLGMTVNGEIPGEFRAYEGRHPPEPSASSTMLADQIAAKDESYIGVGSSTMTDQISRILAEEEAKKAALHDSKMKAKELRIMTQQTADRNLMRQSGYSQAPVIIAGQNDQSSTTISTTINNERKPGARAGFGASVAEEDGLVYSW